MNQLKESSVEHGLQRPEIAYYYPEPFWAMGEAGWIKSLILFFDQVAILLPSYMRDRLSQSDPSLVEPLEDRGLLRILDPDWFVDTDVTNRLTEMVVELVVGGAFDDLPSDEPFAELSLSRAGYAGSYEIAKMVTDELEQRGLARPSTDGVAIPMHWRVRGVYLLLLALLAPDAGASRGLDLQPASNALGLPQALTSVLNLRPMPSKGHVLAFDIKTVGLDCTDVPLDELLGFRRDNADELKAYRSNLRTFCLQLSLISDPSERQRALNDRTAELAEDAADLRSRVRTLFSSYKELAGFGLGLTGAAWSLASGDPVPGLLGLGTALASLLPTASATGNAYSYLFSARQQLTQ